MTGSPFKFLDSYTREDREIFFGRDREIGEMYQKVFEGKILLVYGVSGTGKTSLINCGLANKFEDSDWLPVTVRRGRDMLESLVTELRKVSVTKLKQNSPPGQGEGVVKLLQSLYLDHFKPIYLIFDQFEELFIFGDREEREQFIQVVKAIVESEVQCKFIFSIREEYLASVTEFELTITDFLSNRMRVEKMTRQHAVEVIEGPCKVHGIEVEEGFSEALLNNLNPESNEVELTYLQVFLDKVFKIASQNVQHPTSNVQHSNKNEKIEFEKPLLERIGDVSDLLGAFLEEQISALEDPDTGLAILKSFVSIKGTKKQITEEEVLESSRTYGKDIKTEVLTELIQNFVNLRILRDKDENGRYELRHDSLAAKIYEKITLVEKEIMEVRQLIENAYNYYQQRKVLLSQDDLKFIESYEDRLFLTKELQAFVNKSKEDYLAQRRAFQRIIRISTIGFIIIIAGIGYYFFLKFQGRKTKDIVLTASLQLENSPALSLQTAFSAYEADTIGSLPLKAILDAFYTLSEQHPEAWEKVFNFSPCSTGINTASFSQDGAFIYGWLEDNTVKVWDEKGNELFTTSPDTLKILHVRLSGDNKHIGVLRENEKINVYSLEGKPQFEINTTPGYINDKYLFDFSGRDEYLIAVLKHDSVHLYSREGELFQSMSNHSDRINALDISPDERFLATASSDNNINIWYYNRNIKQFSLYDTLIGHTQAVRSCQFSKTSDYILTASDDSLPRLWDLYGSYSELNKHEYNVRPSIPWTLWIDYNNRFLAGKKCDAQFTEDQQSVKIIAYRSDDEGNTVFHSYILHSGTSIFRIVHPISDYTRKIVWSDEYEPVMEYQSLVPSGNDSYIATVLIGDNSTHLIDKNFLQIKIFDGISPDFSPDGKYLLCIDGNTIHKYVIDIEEIRKLVYEEKIFGDLEINYRDWITY